MAGKIPSLVTILNVDDNPGMLYSKTRIFRKAGFSVLESATGSEALRMVQAAHPALVVLDVNLPDVSGLDVCRQIKSDRDLERTKVLQISASSISPSDTVIAVENGADAYLTEPVDPEILVATAKALIRLHHAEELIAVSNQLLHDILEGIADPVYVKDLEGRYVMVNSAAARGLGQTVESILGKTNADLLDAETAALFAAHDRQVLESGNPQVFEETFRLPDRMVTALVSRSIQYDSQGRPIGVIGVSHDITERKQIEQERAELLRREQDARTEAELLAVRLAESEATYRAIGESIPYGIWICDAEGGAEYVSNSFLELMGLTLDGVREFGWTQAMPAENREQMAADWRRCVAENKDLWDYETRVRDAEGHYHTVLNRGVPVRGSKGQIVRWVGINLDITERKREQERQQFLSEASSELAQSLDIRSTLDKIAHLAVPRVADRCGVYLVGAADELEEVALVHTESELPAWFTELRRRYPASRDTGIRGVLDSGKPVLAGAVTDDMLVAAARDPEHLALLRQAHFSAAMIVPMCARGRVLGALVFVADVSGRRYYAADLAFAENLADRAALAADNADLYRAEQQARRSAERAVERTQRLQALTAGLSASVTAADVARVTAEQAVLDLDARASMVAGFAEDGGTLDILSQVGFHDPTTEGGRPTLDPNAPLPLEECIRTGQPLFFARHEDCVARFPAAAGFRTPVQASAYLPVTAHGNILGGMVVAFAGSREIREADRALMLAMSHQCGQAMDRARLYEIARRARAETEQLNQALEKRVIDRTSALEEANQQLRELAQYLQSAREQERLTIARDLHDTMGQLLAAAKMDLGMLAQAVQNQPALEPARLLEQINGTQEIMSETVTLVRRFVTELRPEILEELGLEAAIEWQVQEFATRSGIQAVMVNELGQPLQMGNEHALALFRIVQESLTNVARHSGATRVETRLRHQDQSLIVEIADNGKGITPQDLAKAKHFGILGQRERARLLNGELLVKGAPGKGTTVTVSVPWVWETPAINENR